MKRYVVIIILLFSVVSTKAQYWDWVTDAKSSQAFIENYGYQMAQLNIWLAEYKKMKNDHKGISEKATFIHMVRDSLFKSLQDVDDILQGDDEKLIRIAFDEIDFYYSRIKDKALKNDMRPVWKQYEKHVVEYSDNLLDMLRMAKGGNDEKNLLDKEQRLALMAFVLGEMRKLRGMSRKTYTMLSVAEGYSLLEVNDKE